MKILHIIHDLSVGGAEKIVYDLLSESAGRDEHLSMELLTLKNSSSKSIQRLEKIGVKTHSLRVENIYNPLVLFKLYRFLKNNEFAVVHAHLFPSLYYVPIAVKLLKVRFQPKLIYTEHSTFNNRRKYLLLRFSDKFIYSQYNNIVAISKAVKSKLIEWIGSSYESQVTVINNGINISTYTSATPYRQEELLGMPNNTNVCKILMVARFTEAKDHITVLKAFKKMLSDDRNYVLIFVGSGPTLNKIKNISFELDLSDKVYFLGDRHDVPRIMKSVDICVLSSHWEGFGLVILEYMASLKPVIASSVDGIKEIMSDYGFLFNVSDYNQLADLINLVCHDRIVYQQQVLKGIEIAQQYDIVSLYKKYSWLYKKYRL